MNASGAPTLSVVVPMYNEQTRLRDGVRAILTHLSNQYPQCEVVLVDDGSQDDTVVEAETLLREFGDLNGRVISLDKNCGKGAAVGAGMKEVTGEVRMFADADNATPIEELDRLLPMVSSARSIVIGSRALRESKIEIHQPWWRQEMGKAFNRILRFLVGLPYRDTQCGFKLFGREAAEICFGQQSLTGFAFDVELLWLAKRAGLDVQEVAVRWRHVPKSRVRAIRDSFRMARDVLKLRLRELFT